MANVSRRTRTYVALCFMLVALSACRSRGLKEGLAKYLINTAGLKGGGFVDVPQTVYDCGIREGLWIFHPERKYAQATDAGLQLGVWAARPGLLFFDRPGIMPRMEVIQINRIEGGSDDQKTVYAKTALRIVSGPAKGRSCLPDPLILRGEGVFHFQRSAEGWKFIR